MQMVALLIEDDEIAVELMNFADHLEIRLLESKWTYISYNTYIFEKSCILSFISIDFPVLPIFYRKKVKKGSSF